MSNFYSILEYVANAGQSQFPVVFEAGYIKKADVSLTVDGVSTPFTWLSDGLISIAPLAGGERVVIQRNTDIDQLSHVYTDGATLTEDNLDDSFKQSLLAAQEANDIVQASMTVDIITGSWDADDRIISNVDDGVDDNDAVNVQQLRVHDAEIIGYKDDAETFAIASQNSATASANSATASANSATASANSATQSSNSATASANSASAAATSASNASTSETNVNNRLDTVQTNGDTVEENIETITSEPVATQLANAATNAASALTSANNAANSATASANSATASANSASQASTSASNAANSATASANSATASANSATDSANSATASANSASAAANSASAALTSENNAGLSESNAANSAGAAAISATSAGNSSLSASNSATAAATTLSDFQDIYHGALASAPTSNVDTGDLYFDTTLNEMRVYDGSVWKSAGSSVNGTSIRQSYTATSGQTTFVVTGGYDATFADVYLNGVKLVNGVDVDVTSGTEVVLTTGAVAGDAVDVVAYGAFEVANTYTVAQTDNLLDDKVDTSDTNYYQKSNILGTVSQSSGVPTGAIIERGSNANGEFVKFADGTLIMSTTTTSGLSGGTFGAYIPNMYSHSLSLTLPAAYVIPPQGFAGVSIDSNFNGIVHNAQNGSFNYESKNPSAAGTFILLYWFSRWY
jgi:hypothetical protein